MQFDIITKTQKILQLMSEVVEVYPLTTAREFKIYLRIWELQ